MKDLPFAITVVEGLVNTSCWPILLEKKKNNANAQKSNRSNEGNNGVKKRWRNGDSSKAKGFDSYKVKAKIFSGCYICNKPHRANHCPKSSL